MSAATRLGLCGLVLALSFALTYAGYSAATQFGDGDNCGSNTNGTNGADVYFMGGGSDCAHMLDGGDFLDGQGGNDGPLDGDEGPDWIIGGAGDDTVHGEYGGDLEDGQDDGDQVADLRGIDTLKGGPNGDIVNARDGSAGDTVNGGDGFNDVCSFDSGDAWSGCETAAN
jgi:hypothetical protein